jgi:enoyl-CoA hydratase/carnithine racemase
MLDSRRLWPGEVVWNAPIALIDLDTAVKVPGALKLPPCPVIGVGDAANPLADHLDAVIEPPVTLEALFRQVHAMPNAAAVVVQLLRLLPGLPADAGLTAESLAYGLLQGSAEHRAWLASREKTAPRSDGRVRQERVGDHLTITLDHPESGNTIDRAMRDELYEAFSLAGLDTEISRVSLRASGRTFSLGAELAEFGTTTDPATAHAIRCLTLPARAAAACAERFEAHVQGGCVGAGLELAAWAQRLTATSDAWFHLPELSMGILPGAGGCVSLTRRIGRQRTALMILSGKRISARQALGWGLVDAIVDEPPADESGADIG